MCVCSVFCRPFLLCCRTRSKGSRQLLLNRKDQQSLTATLPLRWRALDSVSSIFYANLGRQQRQILCVCLVPPGSLEAPNHDVRSGNHEVADPRCALTNTPSLSLAKEALNGIHKGSLSFRAVLSSPLRWAYEVLEEILMVISTWAIGTPWCTNLQADCVESFLGRKTSCNL